MRELSDLFDKALITYIKVPLLAQSPTIGFTNEPLQVLIPNSTMLAISFTCIHFGWGQCGVRHKYSDYNHNKQFVVVNVLGVGGHVMSDMEHSLTVKSHIVISLT